MRFTADRTLRELRSSDGRRRVLGGSPLRMWTLTTAGADLLDRLVAGEEVDLGACDAPASVLVDRFVDAGLLHPDPVVSAAGPTAAPGPQDVTIVIPIRDRVEELGRLLASLERTTPGVPVVVVDDASSDPTSLGRVIEAHGARRVRRRHTGGPAAARADGIAAASTPFVALLDSDCTPRACWLPPLLAHLADPRTAAVAPRVRSEQGTGAISVYERFRSPLDLGSEPAGVRPGSRVSYVPTAALVVRTAAVTGVGGFDVDLRFGEDVDLLWRLVDAGWRVRYEPSVEVVHPPRPGWVAWVRQRIDYGSSAAQLDRRHPGAVAPLRCSPWSAAGWAMIGAGQSILGLAILGAGAATMPGRMRSIAVSEALRLSATGQLGAGRQVARAVLREWWPAVVGGAALSRSVRRAAVASVVSVALEAATDARRSDPRLSARSAALVGSMAVLDDVAYGTGVWLGCLRVRSFRSLVPRLTHP